MARQCLMCRNPAIGHTSRCAEHSRRSGWATRPSIGTRKGIYAAGAWSDVRKRVLAERGRACECRDPRCSHGPVCGSPGAVIDHIIPMAQGGPAYDLSNLQVLCRRCSDRKTAAEGAVGRRRRRRSEP